MGAGGTGGGERGGSEGEGGGAGLVVRPSSVAGAGQGLFVERAVKKGEVVCAYTGQRINIAEMLRRKDPSDRAYVMGFGLNKYLCARDRLHVLARFINDHADPARHNVRFVKLWEERRADVVATRHIAAGEELFVSYGANYWKVHGPLRGEGDGSDSVSA